MPSCPPSGPPAVRAAFVSAALAVLFTAPPLRGADVPRREALTADQALHRDAVERFLRARLYATDGELEQALKEFRRAVDADPDDGHLRREYAEALRDFGVLPEAEQQARKAVELVPGSPWAHRTLGQVLLAKAKDRAGYEDAVDELRQANAKMPGDPVGAQALGQALLRLDQPKEATAVLLPVLDRGRGFAIPLLYAEALEKTSQYPQAEDVYLSILRQDPGSGAATLGLLRLYQASRQPDKALPLIQDLLRRQPNNLALKTQYGHALHRAGRLAEADAVYQEILKADPGNRDALRQYAILLSDRLETARADEILKRLQTLDPTDPDIPYRRALNFVEARRLDEAEAILKELRTSLTARKVTAAGLAPLDGQLAYISYLRKDYETAKARVRPHLVDPEGELNVQALNLLLQIARDQNDDAAGLALAREAVKRKPKAVGVRALYAEFLVRAGTPEEKLEGEKTLDDLIAEDRGAALAAADTWQRLEKYDKAADSARKALELYPEDGDLLFRLAASLEREKKIPEATEAFERLVKVRPDHAAGLNYLGYMWADRGENLDRALQLIQRAVQLDPSNGAYLDSLGWVYFRLGRLEDAEKYLKQAAILNPDDSAVEEHLGDVFQKKGDLAEARKRWEKALTLKPEDGGKALREKLAGGEGKDLTPPAPR